MDDLRVVVAKLRAKAASTSFPFEAQALRAKADLLEARAGPARSNARTRGTITRVPMKGGAGVALTLTMEDIERVIRAEQGNVISEGACNRPPLR